MKITTTLSVSSVILASVLSGCSQQQVVGGSQVSGGSQQQTDSAQVSNVTGGGSQQVVGGSQVAGGSQQAANESQISNVTGGSSQQMTSQQQVEQAVPVVAEPIVVAQPRVYKPRKMQQRVYTRGPVPRVTRTVVKRSSGLPAAKPGQCFAKVKTPAKYLTKTKRVLIQKASTKRVLVRAPQYTWVNKKVLVRKASYRTRTQAAQYRTVTKRVMVKPAYNTWKKGQGAITRIDNATGQIMCLVKVPAVYKTVTQRVLVRPAKTVRTLVPAVYKNVRSMKATAPALYKTVKRPARYSTQSYRVKVGGARYVWKPIVCQTNAPKHYKASVKKRPVTRTTYKKQYRNNGVSRQDYLRVMNAGKAQKPLSRVKAKSSVISQSEYQRVMSAGKKTTVKAKKTSALISKADYLRVMNAGNTKAKASSAKKVEKRAVLKTEKKTKTVKDDTKATAAPTPKTMTGTDSATNKTSIVLGIQKALKAKGFDPGSTDGKMGAGTAAALKAFQSSRGLPVGVLTKDTFRALGLIR